MLHDEKWFLELLQPYKSDDTKKAQRNVSTISFIVISAFLLDVKLTEIKVFGADLSHSSEIFVLLLGLILIVYWSAMLFACRRHDEEVEKERYIQGESAAAWLESRWAEMKDIEAKQSPIAYRPSDYREVKAAHKAYHRQKERTLKAVQYARIIKKVELYVPVFLALSAGSILATSIIRSYL